MLIAMIIHHLCMGIKDIADQIAGNKGGVAGLERLSAGGVHGQMGGQMLPAVDFRIAYWLGRWAKVSD